MLSRWKGAWEDPSQAQEAGRRPQPPQDLRLSHPTLQDRYLVEMRVPGDIVSPFLQGHRAHRAGLGVAAAGGFGGRPTRDGAAGPTGQESQPGARAQRGAHGP